MNFSKILAEIQEVESYSYNRFVSYWQNNNITRKKKIHHSLMMDEDFYCDVRTIFDKARSTRIRKKNNAQALKRIDKHGICKVEISKNSEDLVKMMQWVNSQENAGGFNSLTNVKLMNSKAMGYQPGAVGLANNFLKKSDILMGWYDDNHSTEGFRCRQTIIKPSKINSNGWHIDVDYDQVKVMVFLDKVNYDTGPMVYAEGTHKLDKSCKEFRTHVHQLFKHGPATRHAFGKRNGDYKQAKMPQGASIAYLPDNVVDHSPVGVEEGEMELWSQKCKKFVCVGEPGEAIFFESSGLHSANIVVKNVRKVAIFSFPKSESKKNAFFRIMKES